MAITVNVRVVGIYLGNSVTPVRVTVNDNPTVAEIMTEVAFAASRGQIPNVFGFTYSPFNPPRNSNVDMDSATVGFNNSFRSPSGTPLPGGVYQLRDADGNPSTVLQYYLFDTNFVQVNRNNQFIPFSNVLPPELQIQDGWTVIWRQVSIATGPIQSAKLAARAKRSFKNQAEAEKA